MRITFVGCILSILFFQHSYAQKIDNLTSFRDVESPNYFRFNYDNDFFAATDKNYTQGYSLERVAPFLKKNPLNHLFLHSKNALVRYGLALEHIGFTPNSFDRPEIQVGDRPFAAAITLKSFMLSNNEKDKSRITASLSIGIIGPGAFGKEMQVAIHKATGNKIPLGWRNQIKNDLVLNYELGYEKQLFNYHNLITLQATANAKVGTLFTKGAIGVNTTFGIINNPFSTTDKRKKFVLYAYAQPVLNIIGYDATLQGGFFNKSSPYTIEAGDLERFTGQFNFGVVLRTKTLYFEYSRSLISKEFVSGDGYGWGGIKVGFTL